MQTINQEQYVEVGIATEKYAFKIHEINEIIRMQHITEIPNAAQYVKGVINLRGKIIPIISLRRLFNMEEISFTKQTRIVVVQHVDDLVGIVVDNVNKVTTFSDIQPAPERVGDVNGEYFVGIGITEAGLVAILQLERVLIRDQEG